MRSQQLLPVWQKVGIWLDRPVNAERAIKQAALDYEVQKRPLRAVLHRRTHADVHNHFATVRMDQQLVLGVVGNRYEVVQNTEAFRFFDPLVDRDEAIYETAGVVDGGRSMWLQAKLPGYIRVGKKGDPIEKYLLLVNSHDGSSQIRVKMTSVRIICKNMLSFALGGSDQEIRIKHTGSAGERLEQAHMLLGLWNSLYQQLEYIFNRMALRSISHKELIEYVKTLIPDNPDAESNARTENSRKRLLELHESGIGADLHRGTLFGAYNMVTEYVDWADSKDANKHLKSVFFGTGEKLKQRAFSLAEELIKN